MKALGAALLALGLALGAPSCLAQRQDGAGRQAAAASRQLLVMLRMPPPHYRPDGSYGGGYADDASRAARRRQAAELAAAHGLKLVDGWPMPAIGIDCFVMEAADAMPLERLLDALGRDPRVAWAQPVGEFRGLQGAEAGGGDPLLPLQPAARAWHLAALHRASTGRRVLVAVVDSGVDADHPDLAGQVARRQDFVAGVPGAAPDAAESHGTAVAGIIAARAGNGLGIAGIAPQARLLALRACWETARQETRCNSFTLGKALHAALLDDARIINLSLAGPPDRLLAALIDTALARGVAVVGAVDPARADGGFPASHPGVLAVTAAGDRRPLPAGVLRAPGADIPAPLPGARWGMLSGASYAAAQVAGLSALLVALRPSPPAPWARAFVMAPPAQAGSIDACATLARAAGACVCLCPSTFATTASSLH